MECQLQGFGREQMPGSKWRESCNTTTCPLVYGLDFFPRGSFQDISPAIPPKGGRDVSILRCEEMRFKRGTANKSRFTRFQQTRDCITAMVKVARSTLGILHKQNGFGWDEQN